jgi:hypothetical protein
MRNCANYMFYVDYYILYSYISYSGDLCMTVDFEFKSSSLVRMLMYLPRCCLGI